ncbi:amino acid transporter AVT1H-like [Papaver somniferum]|uniref:amino acid transporter AVT1H-like n=1 Tax=Papaver somniferum TaxID=3469 RepID=UPI000E6F858D|nr:amino acid transporter AVT1H-like [Papaver somniferum]
MNCQVNGSEENTSTLCGSNTKTIRDVSGIVARENSKMSNEVMININYGEESSMIGSGNGNNDNVPEMKVQEQHAKADSSFLHSVINMSGTLIGLGQLSTPYAVQNGGWASAFLLIGFGILCAYTSHLLAECLKNNAKLRNYLDIAQFSFGKKGRVMVSIFMYMEIFMSLVSFTISLHNNLGQVFLGAKLLNLSWINTAQALTVIAIILVLPTVWLRDLSKISFLSVAGILMSLVIFVTIGCTAAFGGIKTNQSIPVLQLNKIPAVSGLYIYSFAAHVLFPDIYKSMRDPSQFSKVSIASFGLVTVFYTGLGFMGAKLFGSGVSSQVTLSMPRHLIITKIALWAVVLTSLTKYAFQLVPVASVVECKLPSSMSSKMRKFIRGTVGSLLLIFVLILALTVPYFENVLGLTGSLVSISVAIIYPCAFYIKIFRPQLSKLGLAFNVFFIIFGLFLGIIGTITSSKSLVQNVGRQW